MRRLALVLVTLALAGCGGKPKAPDIVERQLPGSAMVAPVVSALPAVADFADAGQTIVMGVCCVVPFALTRRSGEVSASVYVPSLGDVAMAQDDAGVWRVKACLPLASDVYVFHVGYPADDEDGGVLLVDRVNDALPTQYGGGVGPVVNVFAVGDAGSCNDLDTRPYSTLPDGG